MFWGWSLGARGAVLPGGAVALLRALAALRPTARASLLLVGLMVSRARASGSPSTARGYPWTDLELYGALYFRTTRASTRWSPASCSRSCITRWTRPSRAGSRRRSTARCSPCPRSPACGLALARRMFGGQNVQLVHVFAWGTVTSLMYFAALILLLLRRRAGCTRLLSRRSSGASPRSATASTSCTSRIVDHIIVPGGASLRQAAPGRCCSSGRVALAVDARALVGARATCCTSSSRSRRSSCATS